MPDEFARYKRGRTVQSDSPLVIPRGVQRFSKPAAPQGWTYRVHPDGAQYFVNEGKRIMTDEIISNVTSHMVVKHFISFLEQYRRGNSFLQQLESSLNLVDDAITVCIAVSTSVMRPGMAATIGLKVRQLPARMMEQFGNCQHWARLDRFQSVHGHISKRTLLLCALSPFLFYIPDSLKKALEDVFVDDLVNSQHYTNFVDRMSAEWREIVLYVVLNVNVAFLAISSVDAATNSGGSRSMVQISSYISAVASIGSIMFGLALIRKTRLKGKETAIQMASTAGYYIGRSDDFDSLPNALFTWGIFLSLLPIDDLHDSNSNCDRGGSRLHIIWEFVGNCVRQQQKFYMRDGAAESIRLWSYSTSAISDFLVLLDLPPIPVWIRISGIVQTIRTIAIPAHDTIGTPAEISDHFWTPNRLCLVSNAALKHLRVFMQ
ncbi:hypothetical protein B0H10DRAFT_1946239 [Mycena sp. CBHHK59/15]|nr:hypothetical protein B0H10DRAFT_1946239 [Mycena sp. CBHHK59/15]